jgi:hypothetical protein
MRQIYIYYKPNIICELGPQIYLVSVELHGSFAQNERETIFDKFYIEAKRTGAVQKSARSEGKIYRSSQNLFRNLAKNSIKKNFGF